MEVDALSFPHHLLGILNHIAEADFVSFDLELSGIPSRQPGTCRGFPGRQTLEDRYQEAKEGADKHQILQVGLTCARFDYIANKYVLRPYNINISPLVDERLNLEREFTFQSGAVQFLLNHGFQLNVPFERGVQYLSRDEAVQIRQAQYDRIDDKNVFHDLQLKKTDVDSLDFLKRVREAISAWKEMGNSSSLDITTHTGFPSSDQPATPVISRFEKRLVHQLIRAEFPELRSMGRSDCIKIIHFNADREDENKARQKHAVKQRLREATGFRWIIEALSPGGGSIGDLDPYYFARDENGLMVSVDHAVIKSKLTRAREALKRHQPALVGHNLFTDLVYFYRTFIGQLPDTLDKFRDAVHEMFPRIVDTKYLATYDGGDLNASPTLQDIAEALQSQELPDIVTHAKHAKYNQYQAFHEAGYDSLLTATIMLRLSAKLNNKSPDGSTVSNQSSYESYKTAHEQLDPQLRDGWEHVTGPVAIPPIGRSFSGVTVTNDTNKDDVVVAAHNIDGLAASLRSTSLTVSAIANGKEERKDKRGRKKKEKRVSSEPAANSRFAHTNAFANLAALEPQLSSSPSTSPSSSKSGTGTGTGSSGSTTHNHTRPWSPLADSLVPIQMASSPDTNNYSALSYAAGAVTADPAWANAPPHFTPDARLDAIQRHPMALLPSFESPFWDTFGNKLRIFGTQETVLEIAAWERPSVTRERWEREAGLRDVEQVFD